MVKVFSRKSYGSGATLKKSVNEVLAVRRESGVELRDCGYDEFNGSRTSRRVRRIPSESPFATLKCWCHQDHR